MAVGWGEGEAHTGFSPSPHPSPIKGVELKGACPHIPCYVFIDLTKFFNLLSCDEAGAKGPLPPLLLPSVKRSQAQE